MKEDNWMSSYSCGIVLRDGTWLRGKKDYESMTDDEESTWVALRDTLEEKLAHFDLIRVDLL